MLFNKLLCLCMFRLDLYRIWALAQGFFLGSALSLFIKNYKLIGAPARYSRAVYCGKELTVRGQVPSRTFLWVQIIANQSHFVAFRTSTRAHTSHHHHHNSHTKSTDEHRLPSMINTAHSNKTMYSKYPFISPSSTQIKGHTLHTFWYVLLLTNMHLPQQISAQFKV